MPEDTLPVEAVRVLVGLHNGWYKDRGQVNKLLGLMHRHRLLVASPGFQRLYAGTTTFRSQSPNARGLSNLPTPNTLMHLGFRRFQNIE